MTTTVSIADLEADRVFVRTNLGRWLKFGCGFGNYWHNVLLPNYSTWFKPNETIIDVQKDRPKLMVGDEFILETDIPRNFGPQHPFVFKIARNDFPFRVRLDNYNITIPFHYESSDARIGIVESKWTCPAGRLMRHLNLQRLRFDWQGIKPVLHIGHKMTVNSQ